MPKSKTFGALDQLIYSKFLEKRILAQEHDILESHIEAVERDTKIVIDLDTESISSIAAYLEWIDGAKSVDPTTYPVSAEKWQEALRQLLKGNKDMLQALQRVTPDTIEHFDKHGAIPLEAAIALEGLEMGSIMPVRRLLLRSSEAENAQTIKRVFIMAGAVGLGPMILVGVMTRLLGMDGALAGWLMVLAAVGGLGTFFHQFIAQESWINRRCFEPLAKFWISDKGIYVLNKSFGGNPDKTVLWPIGPVDEDVEARIAAHIKATPDVERAFAGY
ncbi:hypothetical protein L0664_01465 [Octadecabacter sp. G9-8]|uniref:Uncharacterized protein n=1 Tax=Octadecabacter dasysiphoniae TaxID=2909341 RepID=A0ABS9CSJ4_9RHOB|nr:hypothetical protein [Octadecabacter dasysiphoniae]MCF2869722.1 hypothetical protein [Octadecabacter dasysiphoniae]